MSDYLFCPYCGEEYLNDQCVNCRQQVYFNPAPVAVCLTPVSRLRRAGLLEEHRLELLVVKRSIPPFGWALPGGYIEFNEQVGEAAARELKEETNLDVPAEIKIKDIAATKRQLLIFCCTQEITEQQLKQFQPSNEVSEIKVIDQEEVDSLVFPLHCQAAKQFLESPETISN